MAPPWKLYKYVSLMFHQGTRKRYSYGVADDSPGGELVHRDADMTREVWHSDHHVRQGAPLRDGPVHGYGLGAGRDGRSVEDDVPNRHVEVLRRRAGSLVRIIAADDWVCPQCWVSKERWRVHGITDQIRRHQHVDRARDAVPARRDIDVCRAGGDGVTRPRPRWWLCQH